jgi:hypothetical protein
MKAQLISDYDLDTFEINNITYHALPIKDHPSYYATTSGHILSTKRGETILLSGRESNGYLRVLLGRKEMRVHRLVASTYFDQPDADRYESARNQVNHIDGNRQNNAVTNLEWCSAKENHDHLWQVLRAEDAVGVSHAK